jgi:hypothetical protein
MRLSLTWVVKTLPLWMRVMSSVQFILCSLKSFCVRVWMVVFIDCTVCISHFSSRSCLSPARSVEAPMS